MFGISIDGSLNDDIFLCFDFGWMGNLLSFMLRIRLTSSGFGFLLKFVRLATSSDEEVILVLYETCFDDLRDQMLFNMVDREMMVSLELCFNDLELILELFEFLFHIAIPMVFDVIVSSFG